MYKRFGDRRPKRALSEHREGVDLKKMFPLFVNKEDEALLYSQDITFDTYALTHDWYTNALKKAGPVGLDNHDKIKFATCFHVQDWITTILDVVDCGEIRMTCDTNKTTSQLNCKEVTIDKHTFRFIDPANTGYFQIFIKAPGHFSHEFAGFLREGQAIIYDGANWASDPKVESMLTNFFSDGGFRTDFIMGRHQQISGNCPTFQPVGIFLMLIHGVGNFLIRVNKLGPWDINELIESTALKMKKLMEGPDYALLPFRLAPGAHRLPSPPDPRDRLLPPDPRDRRLLPLPSRDPIRKPPSYEEITRRKPVDITQEEMDDGWASPLSLTYTRKTSPKRKRKTSPKRKRKTSPKRKRKTSPRKRKTSPRKKR